MRSLGTRRVAQAAGAAMAAVIALAGCSAGQVAETAILKAPVAGLNTQSPDGGLLVRNLQVIYNGTEGYEANGTAPIQLSLFNQTEQPLTVTITSKPQQTVTAGIVSAQQVGLSGGEPTTAPTALPSADASAPTEPAEAPLKPAKVTIPGLGSATFLPQDDELLVASGLSGELRPGYSLALTIQVDNGQSLDVVAPFGIPTSPASRAPGIENENHEE
ncbi:hypothetical protein BJ973_007557 [Actinoplanes tereljensis]|uniref:Copper(I)-binding protein n=1 Tax=Paractinoplanes tereljensis TaxID=571912 RepID=A0A919NUA1_9ACTN|nr:hypothetical protein [Actinoplanes tereljensis]GIF24074.1 hypothetical protein Ate02nite_68040 [Actinoplanes tereljensis]